MNYLGGSWIARVGRRCSFIYCLNWKGKHKPHKSTASGALEWLLTGFGLLGSVTSWADFDSSSDYSDDGADFDPD